MAVLIKNMEMPKRCRACDSLIKNEYTFRCLIGKIKFSEVETSESYENYNYIHPKCPFIEYPDENMIWIELKEKCINLNIGKNPKHFYNDTIIVYSAKQCCEYHFIENGDIDIDTEKNKTMFYNMTPYQMWLIIQSIIG